jgi:hypothetical protein
MGQESILHALTHAGPNFPVAATWDHTYNVVKTAFQNLISSKNIVSSITSALQDPALLLAFYKETDPLVSGLYFASALSVITYIVAEITINYSQVGKVYYNWAA